MSNEIRTPRASEGPAWLRLFAALTMLSMALGTMALADDKPASPAPSATASPAPTAAPPGVPAAKHESTAAKLPKGDWPMWGGQPQRNMASSETGLPAEWSIKDKKNIRWVAPLGSQTYGNPVIAGGKVFVGTNNHGNLRKGIEGDKGVIVCLDEKTGKQLWQATHDKLPTGRVNDWPDQGICSTVAVENGRVYYVSNRCELVCADVNGFLDDKNDGPFTDEKYKEKEDADFIWVYDMIEELGVFPHNMASSSPVIWGDLVFCHTSNGVDEGHLNLPVPDAPSFIAVNKNTGKLVWESNLPGKNVLHGQWSSPSIVLVNGKPQALFAGGNGWLYSFDAETGKLVWKFDLNPKDSKYILGGRGTRCYIIGTPVVVGTKVYLGVGQDPEHGEGPGNFYCIDATKEGDVTDTAKIWHIGKEDFHRTLSSAAVADGLLYITDLSGFLYCLDADTGKLNWKHDTYSAIWGSASVADGKVYLGDEQGDVFVFAHGKDKKLLATNEMENSVYSTAVAANGTLFIANKQSLFAIAAGK